MANKLETAIFAAGCFWGVEGAFRKLQGMLKTEVGYTGSAESPTYEQVCAGNTGHAARFEQARRGAVLQGKTCEAVRVEFDPQKISYGKLLEAFFSMHDPMTNFSRNLSAIAHNTTSKNRQGLDFGAQYRSAIFFTGRGQEKEAKEMIAALGKSGKFWLPIVTEVAPAGKFWRAEEYHQKYIMKRSGKASCHV